MTPMSKPDQLRLRVTPDDAALLDRLAGGTLNRNDVASLMLEAAVRAIRNNGEAFSMPLRLRVDADVHREIPLPKRKAS